MAVTDRAVQRTVFVPTATLVPGKNHRAKTDDVTELAESLRQSGLLQAILVRERPANGTTPGGHEIVAGHRRVAAAALLEWDHIEAVVFDADTPDDKILEMALAENLQREAVHALDEAEGFRRLLKKKDDVTAIANRLGKSTRYVYDRLRLLDLIPAAAKLFRDGRITAAHAVLIARQTPLAQKAIIDTEGRDSALFESEGSLGDLFEDEDLQEKARRDPLFGMKARSVGELEAWIATHLRFEVGRGTIDDLFPETVRAVEAARKVVQITENHFVHPDAKEGNNQRIYGPQSWRKADKPCDHLVTGVVVVGPGQGRAFDVCVNKACTVHYGAEIRAKQKAAKERAKSPGNASEREAAAAARDKAAREKAAAAAARWDKAVPAIQKQIATQAAKVSVPHLVVVVAEHCSTKVDGKASPADMIRAMAVSLLQDEARFSWNAHTRVPKALKACGFSAEQIRTIMDLAAEPKTDETPRPARGKKGAKKK